MQFTNKLLTEKRNQKVSNQIENLILNRKDPAYENRLKKKEDKKQVRMSYHPDYLPKPKTTKVIPKPISPQEIDEYQSRVKEVLKKTSELLKVNETEALSIVLVSKPHKMSRLIFYTLLNSITLDMTVESRLFTTEIEDLIDKL